MAAKKSQAKSSARCPGECGFEGSERVVGLHVRSCAEYADAYRRDPDALSDSVTAYRAAHANDVAGSGRRRARRVEPKPDTSAAAPASTGSGPVEVEVWAWPPSLLEHDT